jgi:hypothetical protein
MSTGLGSLYPTKKKDYLDPTRFDTRGPVTQSMTMAASDAQTMPRPPLMSAQAPSLASRQTAAMNQLGSKFQAGTAQMKAGVLDRTPDPQAIQAARERAAMAQAGGSPMSQVNAGLEGRARGMQIATDAMSRATPESRSPLAGTSPLAGSAGYMTAGADAERARREAEKTAYHDGISKWTQDLKKDSNGNGIPDRDEAVAGKFGNLGINTIGQLDSINAKYNIYKSAYNQDRSAQKTSRPMTFDEFAKNEHENFKKRPLYGVPDSGSPDAGNSAFEDARQVVLDARKQQQAAAVEQRAPRVEQARQQGLMQTARAQALAQGYTPAQANQYGLAMLQQDTDIRQAQKLRDDQAAVLAMRDAGETTRTGVMADVQKYGYDTQRDVAEGTNKTNLGIAEGANKTQQAIAEGTNKTQQAISEGNNKTQISLGGIEAQKAIGLGKLDAQTRESITSKTLEAQKTIAELDAMARQYSVDSAERVAAGGQEVQRESIAAQERMQEATDRVKQAIANQATAMQLAATLDTNAAQVEINAAAQKVQEAVSAANLEASKFNANANLAGNLDRNSILRDNASFEKEKYNAQSPLRDLDLQSKQFQLDELKRKAELASNPEAAASSQYFDDVQAMTATGNITLEEAANIAGQKAKISYRQLGGVGDWTPPEVSIPSRRADMGAFKGVMDGRTATQLYGAMQQQNPNVPVTLQDFIAEAKRNNFAVTEETFKQLNQNSRKFTAPWLSMVEGGEADPLAPDAYRALTGYDPNHLQATGNGVPHDNDEFRKRLNSSTVFNLSAPQAREVAPAPQSPTRSPVQNYRQIGPMDGPSAFQDALMERSRRKVQQK